MIVGYIKYSETLDIFKGKIGKWKAINCSCCLCKKYIPNPGFINQICISICAYNLVAYNLNVKEYFTLLVDAIKMYLVFVEPARRCGVQVLFL